MINDITVKGAVVWHGSPNPSTYHGRLQIDQETVISFSLYRQEDVNNFRTSLENNSEIILTGKLKGCPIEIEVESWNVP
jgi:hypothetical protein